MRIPTTDSRGWTSSRRRRFTLSARAILLLFVLSTAGGLFTSATPHSAAADELSDAYAKQKALQKLIAKQKASIADLNASQSALSREIAGTKDDLAALTANLLAVKVQIVSMEVEVARSQGEVDELVATGVQLDAELGRLEADEARKQADLNATKALLASRIREAYDTDRTPMLDTILSSGDFTDVLTEASYHLDFAEQDKVLAEQIKADQGVLDVLHQNVTIAKQQTDQLHILADEAKAKLDMQMSDLNDTRHMLAKLQAATEKLLAEQKAAFARMSRDKAQLARQLAAAKSAQDQLEALIAKLVREQLAKGGIPSEYNGSLHWPMGGTITQEFGCTGFGMEPPLGNCPHFHTGIDIAKTMYTPIRAAGAGKVIWSGRSPYDPSWIVIIAHSSHLVTWYAHIDNNRHPPRVQTGDYVADGEVIAYEGMTGWTTGPHLHWAVQLDGNWVNPRLFLPR
ncbi:MAG TPA: peptidoglycan DD-metalloendopeptidase family protein [Patescibacteria group bacterium]|nr:peptidoglycan DD-metalloendopeptidase family protein [Patescibacteria group bacterium]